MIAKLTGKLDETGADWAVIDVRASATWCIARRRR